MRLRHDRLGSNSAITRYAGLVREASESGPSNESNRSWWSHHLDQPRNPVAPFLSRCAEGRACKVGDVSRGMISDQDAYRTANVQIKRYGADSRSVIFP